MFNPWSILAGVFLMIATYLTGDHFGHVRGINEQKVTDQAQFDQVNAERASQIAEANANWRTAANKVIQQQAENDALKKKLGDQYVQNTQNTNRLSAAYDALGLRYRAEQDPGYRQSGGCTAGTEGTSASVTGASIVQLPDEITRSLRQLALNADRLNDAYKLCYGYVNR